MADFAIITEDGVSSGTRAEVTEEAIGLTEYMIVLASTGDVLAIITPPSSTRPRREDNDR